MTDKENMLDRQGVALSDAELEDIYGWKGYTLDRFKREVRAILSRASSSQDVVMSEREAFEAAMTAQFGEGEDFTRDAEGCYTNRSWHDAWIGWQASRASSSLGVAPLTYTVDGVTMSQLEYIAWLNEELARASSSQKSCTHPSWKNIGGGKAACELCGAVGEDRRYIKLDDPDLDLADTATRFFALAEHWKREALKARASSSRGVALSDEQINEAFDSFSRPMSLVKVLYLEDAHRFARCLLAGKSQDGTISADDAVAGIIDLFPSADRQSLNALAEILCKPAPSRASSSRAEVEIPAALEVVEAWGYDEGGQWDNGYALGWNAYRDAMLAAAEAPNGEKRDA